jgi:hypothetical protein
MAYSIGSSITGTTWNMRAVSGKITEIHPGLGFTVEKDLYHYLIIDNISLGEKSFNHHIESSPPEYTNIHLTKPTVLFWLSRGLAKSTIYGKEIRNRQLIDPMSYDGLVMGFKVAPLIKPKVLNHSDDANDFYLKFGTFPGDSDKGNAAPLTLTGYIIQEEKNQMDAWHFARAKIQKEGQEIEGNYIYHFLDCGHKLRVELSGHKVSLIHFNYFGVHKTPYASPALTFTLKAPPAELSLDGKPAYNLTKLTASALYQGIEEAYWQQRRIRETKSVWHTDMEYINSMDWMDAAWDEIQARREEEGAADVQNAVPQEDAVESHY